MGGEIRPCIELLWRLEMSIAELLEQFEILGAYHIKVWNVNVEGYVTLAEGVNFEYEHKRIKEEELERKITFMYAIDGVLVIEVEGK